MGGSGGTLATGGGLVGGALDTTGNRLVGVAGAGAGPCAPMGTAAGPWAPTASAAEGLVAPLLLFPLALRGGLAGANAGSEMHSVNTVQSYEG